MQRINKSTAKSLNAKGVEVFMCPSNLSPTAFNGAFLHSLGENDKVRDWKQLTTHFKYYNCTSAETGHQIHWYRR